MKLWERIHSTKIQPLKTSITLFIVIMCYSDTKIVLAVVGKSRSGLQVSNRSNTAADNKRWQQMTSTEVRDVQKD